MAAEGKEKTINLNSEQEMKSCFVKVLRRKFTKAEIADLKGNSSEETSESSSNESSSSESDGDKKRSSAKKTSKKLSCKVCKKEFNSDKQLVVHNEKMHTAYPFKCVICRSTFKLRTNFTNHMKREHPESELYRCVYRDCGRSFSTKKQLSDHKNIHFQFVCKFCEKRYVRKREMLSHISEVH